MRDLGRTEPWQDSLERSLARRRERAARTSAAAHEPRPTTADDRAPNSVKHPAAPSAPAKDLAAPTAPAEDRPSRPRSHSVRRRAKIRRRRLTAAGSGGLVTVMLLAIILPSAFADRGPHSVRRAAYRSGAAQANGTSGRAAVEGMLPAQPTVCHPSAAATGYSNPLANATVRGERIDQGVDYAGTGSLVAIGAGRVTYVGTSGTGWPGAYLQYQLLDGPNAGCYVFYAEGVTPVSGLRVGDTISRGQTLATIIPGWPTGIELGWGAGDSTKTYTAKTEGWTAKEDHADHASAAGKSFSELIRALGGPAGKIEG